MSLDYVCSCLLIIPGRYVIAEFYVSFFLCVFFFFKQKTAYELRISDWSSDVCSSDLPNADRTGFVCGGSSNNEFGQFTVIADPVTGSPVTYNNTKDGAKTWVPYDNSFRYNYAPDNYIQRSDRRYTAGAFLHYELDPAAELYGSFMFMDDHSFRSEEHTSELQSLMRISYAVFCLKKKKHQNQNPMTLLYRQHDIQTTNQP